MVSSSSVHEVNTTISVNDVAELADLETKSGVLEWLLHLTSLEEAQITTCFGR